jgi:hypothetical protein
MLLTFSANADREPKDPSIDTDEYARCIRQYPCDLEDKSLHHLPKVERDKILHCRVVRHMKCVQPEETMTLDPVFEYYKIYGEYLND